MSSGNWPLTARGALLLLLFSVWLAGCTGNVRQNAVTDTAVAEPFLGIEVAPDVAGKGLKIARIWPGPVMQALQRDLRIDIRRHRLVRIDDRAVNKTGFRQIVARLSPGQRIQLAFAAPNKSEATDILVDVVVGDRNDWTGPIAKHAAAIYAERTKAIPRPAALSGTGALLQATATQQGLGPAIVDLHQLFQDWQQDVRGFHSLSRVLFPFQHPYRLPELQQQVSAPLDYSAGMLSGLFAEIARNLDLAEPAPTVCPSRPLFSDMVATVQLAQTQLGHAFPGWDQAQIDLIYSDLHYLLREMSRQRTLTEQQFPERSLNAMNSSMAIDYEALLVAASGFSCFLDARAIELDLPARSPPSAELKQIITGDILAAIKTEHGWIIYGGPGDNHYDLQGIAAVYDPAGNDTYFASVHQAGVARLIIDHAGNDRYSGDHAGAGSAWLGVSMLIEHAGDDIYTGELAVNGSGAMGIGMLIDFAGADLLEGQYFANGAGFYGAGVVVNLGDDDDRYQSSAFSQGLGGPRALGLIFDEAGDDRYLANYRMPSVYGDDGVFAGFSQGFGFGMRYYDSGGVGVIVDKQGNDHYDGGEFSQGGAYYWGLGILHDHAGNDSYSGSRYSQGFGVHQASGVLRDDSGDDSYEGMTAACQGAAWDVALGLLIDGDGDDRYQGDGLCQGAAAMQAQAWLLDMSGADSYAAQGNSIQGNSGSNHYHFNPEQPVYSWSVLADLGPGKDRYSTGRSSNQVTTSSQFDATEPGNSRAYGLFIDLPGTHSAVID